MKQAAFVVVPSFRDGNLMVAGTTRVESSAFGLPGGKLDDGESVRDCAIREAREEGFDVWGVSETPFHVDMVGDTQVSWFLATTATMLTEYKERGRITPMWITLDQLGTDFGNACVHQVLAIFDGSSNDNPCPDWW